MSLKVSVTICALLVLSSCTTSQEVTKRNRHDYDPTQIRTVDETNPQSSNLAIDELRRENAVLKGEIEELKAAQRRQDEIWAERVAQLEKEKQKLAEQMNQRPANSEDPNSFAAVSDQSLKKLGATELWQSGLMTLREKDWEGTELRFERLIQNFPKSSYIPRAQLALAMIKYQKKEYREAALQFNQMIDRHPKRRETALAWFGQGASFVQLGQNQDAKLFFSEVVSRYPQSAEAIEAKKIIDKKRKVPSDLFAAFPNWYKDPPRQR